MTVHNKAVHAVLETDRESFLTEWLAEASANARLSKTAVQDLTREARTLAEAVESGLAAGGDPAQFETAAWAPLREALAALSASRAAQGATAGDTSQFVLAMKRPVFSGLQRRLAQDSQGLIDTLWWASTLVDKMAQFTVTAYQRSREEVIVRQQQELLELSTPVVKLWDGVLAVPMIGTLDSSRTQLVMEALLQRIVESSAELAIIDITGVPTVDTLVAQHLLKTVTAIRLMGAECIISGIRPQIAQTIVHLGIDLQGITTKASLADALALALKSTGYSITRAKS
ncbi:STAS domain-containing protein [Caldimonas brevitalea]|uniref:RsbT co-antagonist protein RsbR n=1 Tax=Caldimonas brevitalea TaxID=413882 RepID=A0A0G3BHE1_9BURK|nr:STAS domain-containing protein [Caldimonas brevitalea]AKJ27408.1 rsbT co-antagonist protein RsbR [Caldimonas brevitalea]